MVIPAPTTARTRAAAAARAGLGALLVTRPDVAARLLAAPRRETHPVLRVLGLRHLIEAAAIASRPTSGMVAGGLVVDGTHVLSCLAYAAVSPSHRRPALRDAAAASTVLVATWLSRPQLSGPQSVQSGHPAVVAARASGTVPQGARLVFVAGGQAPAGGGAASGVEEFIALAPGVEMIIGCSQEADVSLNDAATSPRHLAVLSDGQGHARLRDLGSQNGTTVNGVPVLTADLHDGDRIGLGASALVYRCPPRSDAARP